MRKILLIIAIVAVTVTVGFAQKNVAEAKISTSAQCGACKSRIEKALTFEKGVKSVDLNLETKDVMVSFDSTKTNIENLLVAINNVGYDANESKANEKKYQNLPKCCQKPQDGGGH